MSRRPVRALAAVTVVVLSAGLLGTAPPGSADDAAKPAKVRVVIDDGAAAGRIASSRSACERQRRVTVLGRQGDTVLYGGEGDSDNQGRWRIDARRGGTVQAFAVVPGDRTCRVARSRTVPVTRAARRPASVRITLQAPNAVPRGRVGSSRRGCEQGADVGLWGRDAPGTPWQFGGTATTDAQGRYTFGGGMGRLAPTGDTYQLTTVALGNGRCRVAQSNIVTVLS